MFLMFHADIQPGSSHIKSKFIMTDSAEKAVSTRPQSLESHCRQSLEHVGHHAPPLSRQSVTEHRIGVMSILLKETVAYYLH